MHNFTTETWTVALNNGKGKLCVVFLLTKDENVNPIERIQLRRNKILGKLVQSQHNSEMMRKDSIRLIVEKHVSENE